MLHIFTKNSSKLATVMVSFDAGSRAEGTKYTPGVAHYLEHMLFTGTTNRSGEEIIREIAYLGGSTNAMTSDECVTYYITLPIEHIEKGCEILSDMVFNSTIPQDAFDKEKEVIKEEELGRSEDVLHDFSLFVNEKILPPILARPVIGTQESIESITREELVKFYNEHYTKKSGLVGLAGNLKKKQAKELLTKYFGRNTKHKLKTAKEGLISHGQYFEFLEEDTEQSHVTISIPAVTYSDELKERATQSILLELLGGDMDCRLFKVLRTQNNLVYGVGVHNHRYRNFGLNDISFSCKDSSVEKALSLIEQELELIKTELVSDEELQRTKNKLRSAIYSQCESSSGYLLWVMSYAFFTGKSKIDTDKLMQAITSVTAEDIKALASKLFQKDKIDIFVCKKGGEINEA